MREKYIENKIKNYLKSKNVWYVKYFANSYTPVGIPDILACVNGKFVGIEVKNEIGKTTLLQDYNIKKIKESGGYALIVNPESFEKFKIFIAGLLSDEII